MNGKTTWDWMKGGGPVDSSKDGDGFIEENVKREVVRQNWVAKKMHKTVLEPIFASIRPDF